MKKKQEILGFIYILLGVLIFAGTVPFTKMALQSFTPVQIGTLRVLIGGSLSLAFIIKKSKVSLLWQESGTIWKASLGMGLFPLLLSISLGGLPASFGSVALGLIPLGASLFAIFVLGEKVKSNFLFFAGLGSSTVIVYSFTALNSITYHLPLIFVAIGIVSVGYSYGAQLSRKSSGPVAVSLANIFVLPFAIVGYFFLDLPNLSELEITSVIGIAYLSIMSQFLGFFPFYSGLSKVGTAKGVQVQLLQPTFTLILSYFLIGAELSVLDFIVSFIVVGMVYFANRKDVASDNVEKAKDMAIVNS
ncbi:MAG: hypothetical protein BM556_13440 [Bacteriovorax sp. MedPE-SWde]|mgnify:FL=1|nr:MAG: hypothetical protein BM556_13440 [Bacteriovorax sp. MedPE-SWde]